MIDEAELNARVEAEMKAETDRKRAALREEIAAKERHKAAMAHLDEIERQGRERDARQAAWDTSPERDVILEKSREAMRTKAAKADEEFQRAEAARAKVPQRRDSLRGTGEEGFERKVVV
jgi:hypothetical protein